MPNSPKTKLIASNCNTLTHGGTLQSTYPSRQVLQPATLDALHRAQQQKHNASPPHRQQAAASHYHHKWAAGVHAGQGACSRGTVDREQQQTLSTPPPKRNTLSHIPAIAQLQLSASQGELHSTSKETERLRLKQMSEERSSKWPNTLQVRWRVCVRG